MRVLFFSYPSAFQNVGGGEILLLKMKEYLEKSGVEVKLFDMWADRVEQYDILHVFGSVKDCLGLVKVARSRGVPVVNTPILWSSWKMAFFSYGAWRAKAKLILRHFMKWAFPFFPSARRELLLSSDLLFPSSEMERHFMRRMFAIPDEKMRVIHHATDRLFLNADPVLFRQHYPFDRFILSVGRIEPRKNQLNLVRAAKKLLFPLVIVGDPVSGFEEYAQQCRLEAPHQVHFLGGLPHDSPLLLSAYAACDLFVLPGWFETPGLAALEAGLAGARLAVTECGSTREYFKEHVEYFDPSSPSKIAQAIARALARPKEEVLKQHILDHFTWEKVALDTRRAYEEIS
ncbi:MAG: glycosyltransferase family 4 protein [Deltaproteobacteria bacterium]|nr:glycosyltransferase family 4 protein [Deltaproteobacteria bacterium]